MLRKFIFLFLVSAISLGGTVYAQSNTRSLRIENAWARLSTKGDRTAVVYFEIWNGSDRADELMSVWTPIAEKAVIMYPNWKGLKMTMERASTLKIEAFEKIIFRPGMHQIDLTGLTRELHTGQSIPLEIKFRQAGRMELSIPVVNKMIKSQEK